MYAHACINSQVYKFQQMKNIAEISWCSLCLNLQCGANMQKPKSHEEKPWRNKILIDCHNPIEKKRKRKKKWKQINFLFNNEDENIYSPEKNYLKKNYHFKFGGSSRFDP